MDQIKNELGTVNKHVLERWVQCFHCFWIVFNLSMLKNAISSALQSNVKLVTADPKRFQFNVCVETAANVQRSMLHVHGQHKP